MTQSKRNNRIPTWVWIVAGACVFGIFVFQPDFGLGLGAGAFAAWCLIATNRGWSFVKRLRINIIEEEFKQARVALENSKEAIKNL